MIKLKYGPLICSVDIEILTINLIQLNKDLNEIPTNLAVDLSIILHKKLGK